MQQQDFNSNSNTIQATATLYIQNKPYQNNSNAMPPKSKLNTMTTTTTLWQQQDSANHINTMPSTATLWQPRQHCDNHVNTVTTASTLWQQQQQDSDNSNNKTMTTTSTLWQPHQHYDNNSNTMTTLTYFPCLSCPLCFDLFCGQVIRSRSSTVFLHVLRPEPELGFFTHIQSRDGDWGRD